MVGRAEIHDDVFDVLRTCCPGRAIREDMRLIADLKLASDDATAMALELERTYKVNIARPEWRSVLTVRDVIDLLVRHLDARKS